MKASFIASMDLRIALCIVLFSICPTLIQGQSFQKYVPYRDGDKWGYCDLNGVIKIQPKFEKTSFYSWLGYAEIHSKNGRYMGIIDTLGEPILPCRYFNIEWTPYFYKALDTIQNKFGLYSPNGKLLLKHEFDEMRIERQYAQVKKGEETTVYHLEKKGNLKQIFHVSEAKVRLEYNWFEEDLSRLIVEKDDKISTYSKDGKLISEESQLVDVFDGDKTMMGMEEPEFDELRESSWDIYRDKNGKFGITYFYMGREKPDTFPADYEFLMKGFLPYPFYSDNAFYYAKKFGKFGVINIDNKELIPFKFDSICVDPGAYAAAATNVDNGINFIVKNNGLWGVVNTHNKYDFLLPCIYDEIDPRQLPWMMLTKNGKYGFAHISGNNIIGIVNPKYTAIKDVKYNFYEQTIFLVEDLHGEEFWVNLNGIEYFKK